MIKNSQKLGDFVRSLGFEKTLTTGSQSIRYTTSHSRLMESRLITAGNWFETCRCCHHRVVAVKPRAIRNHVRFRERFYAHRRTTESSLDHNEILKQVLYKPHDCAAVETRTRMTDYDKNNKCKRLFYSVCSYCLPRDIHAVRTTLGRAIVSIRVDSTIFLHFIGNRWITHVRLILQVRWNVRCLRKHIPCNEIRPRS